MQHRGKSVTSVLMIACMMVLAACAGTLPPLAQDGYEPPVYRLAPGDKLNITVFGEEALTKEYVITSAGDLAFPLLGDVQAAGKTSGELSVALTSALSRGYLNDPRVNIEVLNYRPFFILGEVQTAGEYPYRDGLTVSQAVALAKGYTYRADQRRVFIRRADDPEEKTFELSSQRPVYIQPGDTVRVGQRYF